MVLVRHSGRRVRQKKCGGPSSGRAKVRRRPHFGVLHGRAWPIPLGLQVPVAKGVSKCCLSKDMIEVTVPAVLFLNPKGRMRRAHQLWRNGRSKTSTWIGVPSAVLVSNSGYVTNSYTETVWPDRKSVV